MSSVIQQSTNKKRTRTITQRNVNFSKDEEDWLMRCVLQRKEVLLDKKSNAHTVQQKQAAWKKVEDEFNSSSTAKVFRSAKQLTAKFKQLKMNLRKTFAENRLARSLTGGGKAPPDVDITLSQTEQELHSAIKFSIEGLKPMLDDDCEVQVDNPKRDNVYDDLNAHSNSGDEINLAIIDELNQSTSGEKRELFIEFSEDNLNNIVAAGGQIMSTEENMQSSSTAGNTSPIASPSNKENVPVTETWKAISYNPTISLLRRKKKPPCKSAKASSTDEQHNSMEGAKRIFYENEEQRAAERHRMQMTMWEEERKRKGIEHRKRVELYDVCISRQKAKGVGKVSDLLNSDNDEDFYHLPK